MRPRDRWVPIYLSVMGLAAAGWLVKLALRLFA